MKTKIISLKEFRQNITKLWKESRADNIRFIVMFHSKPILEVLPMMDDYLSFDAPVERTPINASDMAFYKKQPKKTTKKKEIKAVEQKKENEIDPHIKEVQTPSPIDESINSMPNAPKTRPLDELKDLDYIRFTS